ncbi:hypothetical protein AMECASPLE_022725 [Ameca splendens]|uniref:Microtubule-actin cross-linking factor 1 n=1 Tax=Ameca splendens TaxID=208324 RepID=A0ABV0XH22_9TELE
MWAAGADSSALQSGSVPVGPPERLAGRKLQDAGAAPSAEEDGGSPSPGGLKWGEGSAADGPLRRFTWSQTRRSPVGFSNMEEVQDKPRRRPLVRAASEESSSDLSSISCSPFPGDTLPWNLPKHHRMKRSKSASGDVLDPAERAVIRIAVSLEDTRLICDVSAAGAAYLL